jgi:hypothetical protein
MKIIIISWNKNNVMAIMAAAKPMACSYHDINENEK